MYVMYVCVYNMYSRCIMYYMYHRWYYMYKILCDVVTHM